MQKTARLILSRYFDPIISTDNLARMLGIKKARLQQWVHRGHVTLSRPGTGRSLLFSPGDSIKAAAFYHLSELHIPPAKIAGDLFSQIEALIVEQLNEIADIRDWRENARSSHFELAQKHGFEMAYEPAKRFAVIFSSDYPSNLKNPLTISPDTNLCVLNLESIEDSAMYFYSSSFVVIDCKKAAVNIVARFESVIELLK